MSGYPNDEITILLPKEYAGWELYDLDARATGGHAVYGHSSGVWLAIRPGVTLPEHEAQLFVPDGSPESTSAEVDTADLIDYLSQNAIIRLREGIRTGGAQEAYAFALLE